MNLASVVIYKCKYPFFNISPQHLGLIHFIPVIGYIDDIFVLGLVFSQVKSDLEEYEIWKNS